MSDTSRTKLLFVCGRNRIRSVTAERLFAGSQRCEARSRGVSKEARQRLSEKDLRWADVVFVMEKDHKNRIVETFPDAGRACRIEVLFIDDVYELMEPALIEVLRDKLADWLDELA